MALFGHGAMSDLVRYALKSRLCLGRKRPPLPWLWSYLVAVVSRTMGSS